LGVIVYKLSAKSFARASPESENKVEEREEKLIYILLSLALMDLHILLNNKAPEASSVMRAVVGGHAGPVGVAHQPAAAEATRLAAQTARARLSQVVARFRTLGAALEELLARLTLFDFVFF
jgi:hypothetical protein